MNSYDRALDAFQDIFLDPVPFGSPGARTQGASDGAKGVQWNFWFRGSAPEVHLGINLEGMKYGNWPISDFLQAEITNPTLSSLWPNLSKTVDPLVRLSRDAWQAKTRIPIHETLIGDELPLSRLTQDAWEAILTEALKCLDQTKSYRGRVRQTVTRVKDDQSTEMWVSPHVSVYSALWNTTPTSHSEACDQMSSLKRELSPIYDLIQRQSLLSSDNVQAEEEMQTESLAEAAEFALRYARPGSATYRYLSKLQTIKAPATTGYYVVNPRRFVWWRIENDRLARLETKSKKLALIVKNSLLEGIKLPIGAKPHKNPAMTQCSTDNDSEIDELCKLFSAGQNRLS